LTTPENSEAAYDLRRLDFWLLFGISFAALVGFSFFGVRSRSAVLTLLMRFPARSVVLFAIVPVLLASGASRLPPRAGFSVLPILEGWRARSLMARDAAIPVAIGAAVGTLQSYAVVQYVQLLKNWFGPATSTRHLHHQLLNVGELISGSIIEEIFDRGVIFAVFVIAIRWVWEAPISRKSIPIWVANILQALVFGADHISLGVGGLYAWPWYVSLPLLAQTWGGIILGCVYWKYGLESAIICHATYDVLVLKAARHIIRIPVLLRI
jgi:hypothetical protein